MWITAAQFSRVFPDNCYNGCSLSSTPPLVSRSPQGSRSTSPPLRELHWLKVPERIQFRLCVLIGKAPSYLAETLHSTADVVLQSRRWSHRPHDAPRWVIEPSRSLLLERGTLYRRLFVLRHHCCSSAATSRRHCFSHRTLHHSVRLCDRL